MDLAQKIKSLLKGADIYREQGLLIEARENYRNARQLIEAHPQIKNRDKLLQGLAAKLDSLDQQIHTVENAPITHEVSEDTQALIKRLFAFSPDQDEDSAALDGAIALTKFGQYGRAMKEFEALLDRESVRLVAAKNMLRCHLATDAVDNATAQYAGWLDDPRFDPDSLVKIRSFLQMLLRKKQVEVTLPEPAPVDEEAPLIELPIEEPADDEVLDISAVTFQVATGPRKGNPLKYEVSFQSGNVISILIAAKEKDVVEALKVGDVLADVELTSPVAIFNGTAQIMEKNQIKVGPRQGCFSVDLKIKNA